MARTTLRDIRDWIEDNGLWSTADWYETKLTICPPAPEELAAFRAEREAARRLFFPPQPVQRFGDTELPKLFLMMRDEDGGVTVSMAHIRGEDPEFRNALKIRRMWRIIYDAVSRDDQATLAEAAALGRYTTVSEEMMHLLLTENDGNKILAAHAAAVRKGAA
jgi:hypothetical protein